MRRIDVLKAIKERRSIYNFKHEEVKAEILTEIFTYGSWAPSHYMKEPWNINLYQEKGKDKFVDAVIASHQRLGMLKTADKQKSLKMTKSMKNFLLAIPHHALIYLKKDQNSIRYEEDYAAVCAFIQNAQLAAWSFGVGMLWTITPYMHDPYFAEDIGLEKETVKIAAVMQIGYPQKIPLNKDRIPIKRKMNIIKG